MDILNLVEINETTNDKNSCKGLIYRASVSSYSYDGIIGTRKTLRLLKRKSCKGCEHCEWMKDYVDEYIVNDFYNVDFLDKIEHGKLYTFSVSFSKGYYDLYAEPGEIDIIEYK